MGTEPMLAVGHNASNAQAVNINVAPKTSIRGE
jgi:hypothetical protein